MRTGVAGMRMAGAGCQPTEKPAAPLALSVEPTRERAVGVGRRPTDKRRHRKIASVSVSVSCRQLAKTLYCHVGPNPCIDHVCLYTLEKV